MKNNHTTTLKEAIHLLKLKQDQELLELKDQYYYTYESLKPVNIIKKAFGQMTQSSEFRGNVLSNVIGIASGYLTKKVLVGSTHNPVKRILGTLLQFVITNVVTKKTEKTIDNEMLRD
ncbi:hypothetical protein J3S90_10275 [Flavobacterium sp. P4023]|uniref:EcsC protein family protein n=1 Tax=Flavobacterium flabelliforme TaxID=2816119 RepID=A0ABS5CU94_9FLAO|nr:MULTISPECIES: hypothetical protein [Flavobacterium]MBP4142187.1 hypothetical protein [Flavobacterium flabelliforme]